MNQELSNYSINEHGVLVLNSLKPKTDKDGNYVGLTPQDFQEEYHITERDTMIINFQYEVLSVNTLGLLHGKPIAEKKGLDYVRVGRCFRAKQK